jgi:hypothetical protein
MKKLILIALNLRLIGDRVEHAFNFRPNEKVTSIREKGKTKLSILFLVNKIYLSFGVEHVQNMMTCPLSHENYFENFSFFIFILLFVFLMFSRGHEACG